MLWHEWYERNAVLSGNITSVAPLSAHASSSSETIVKMESSFFAWTVDFNMEVTSFSENEEARRAL